MTDEKNAPEFPGREGAVDEPIEAELASPSRSSADHDAYHIVTDTIVGPNVRWKDNVFQAVAILVCAALGALAAWLIWKGPGEALAGAFAGLVVGLLGSGVFLMLYRAMRHISGRHD